jgi:hypothetical protein
VGKIHVMQLKSRQRLDEVLTGDGDVGVLRVRRWAGVARAVTVHVHHCARHLPPFHYKMSVYGQHGRLP